MNTRTASIRQPRLRLRALALGLTALSALTVPGTAVAGPTITVGEPEGFEDLARDRTLLVDVYFGGVRRGEAKINAVPGEVSFLEPAAALALLPELAERGPVEAALAAGNLPANGSLVCSRNSDPAQCGRLDPDVVGVIFDREHFRIDIFLNPRFVAIQENVADTYLPKPPAGLAAINTIGAVVSGETGAGSSYYNFQDSLVVGDGERRLRADLSYATDLGIDAERIALEWDRPGLRYSGGLMWSPGNDISGRRKLLGAGIATQIDTRLDRDTMLGTPVVLYLDQRARVDIVRDGRVLASAIYSAGNQQLDTSTLPDGSYDIVVRIQEPGRPAREERRFYTKSRRVPSAGRTDFFAFAGMLVDETGSRSFDVSSRPYFQGGIAHRIDESWALDGTLEATDRTASAEVGATFLTDFVLLRGAALASVTGAYGGVLQVMSAGSSRFNFNFDLRVIEADDAGAALPASPTPRARPDPFAPAAWQRGSYSQAGGAISYSLANVRLLGTFFYRDDPFEQARYSLGPSVELDVLRNGPLTLTFRGEATATDRGNAGFAGLSLRLLGRRTMLSALAGARASGLPGDELGEGPVGAVSGAWTPTVAGGELALGGGFEHQPRQDNIVGSAEFRHSLGSLAGDLVHTDGENGAATQYTLGLQTTLIAGGGTVQVAGKTTTESMIVAHVRGAQPGDRFDVFVNDQVAGTVVGPAPVALALPAYRAYAVRIRPTGERLLSYDSAARTVSLYPGTVADLDWSVSPITVKFGRLTAPDGTPLRGASITGKGIWSETDEQGYFQIEAPDDAALEVTLPDGRTFGLTLPAGPAGDAIARLGAVVCCGEPGPSLASSDNLPQLANGGAR